MLTALRSLANTFVAKLLFGLLVISFAVWGVGDVWRGLGRDDAIARVGDATVEAPEVQNGLQRELARLSRRLGREFEATPEVRLAVARQVTEALVIDRVLRQEAARLGLAAPDDAVRDYVFGLEAFRGIDGRFSRPLFDSFLRNNGTTEPYFLELVRADVLRRQVTEAVSAGARRPPDAMVRALAGWRLETRAATVVTLTLADAPEPAVPDLAALRRYQENNPERFSLPERRQAEVAVLTAERITREIEVSDGDVEQAYAARLANYVTPERRFLEQLLLPDRAQAAALAARWRGGEGFAALSAAAEAAGGSGSELGDVDRAGLPFAALAEAAFALPAGGVTDPVQSDFGWHVLRTLRIEAGGTRSLAEVRDALRAELASERAADLAFERANRVEDALAGGSTLAEVAARYGLGHAVVDTDRAGLDPAGQPIALPVIEASRDDLLRLIFAADPAAAPRLTEGEAGFAAISIRAVRAPELRPFEQVEGDVRAAWTAEARRRTQEERAAGLLGAVRGGATLATAATAAGLGSREVAALRRDAAAVVPAELLAPLFELPPGETTMVATRDGFVVAQVTGVDRPDPTPTELDAVRAEAAETLARDLETQALTALRARAGVRLNTRALETLARP